VAVQPRARPIARHGLKALNTSPNSTLSGTSPTHQLTNTNVGVQFAAGLCVPLKPM
jgi:hypothetical protein